MRNFNISILMVAVLTVCAVPASASSIYLTLSGTISNIYDRAGLASDSGYSRGDTLNYIISLDTDRIGSSTTHNDRTSYYGGTFYTALESGNLNGWSQSAHSVQNNWGTATSFQSGNENSNLYLTSWDSGTTNFSIGDTFTEGYEISYTHGNHYTRLDFSNLVVTNVATAPTPAPAGILLLGLGLPFVGFIRSRIRTSI